MEPWRLLEWWRQHRRKLEVSYLPLRRRWGLSWRQERREDRTTSEELLYISASLANEDQVESCSRPAWSLSRCCARRTEREGLKKSLESRHLDDRWPYSLLSPEYQSMNDHGSYSSVGERVAPNERRRQSWSSSHLKSVRVELMSSSREYKRLIEAFTAGIEDSGAQNRKTLCIPNVLVI